MRFITGVILGIVIALGSPASASDVPGQGDGSGAPAPASSQSPGECSATATSQTFSVANQQGQTRIVTKTVQDCGAGYTLVTRYKSPWVG